MSVGVPAGTETPLQPRISKPGNASLIVGSSGNGSEPRFSAVVAKALTRPDSSGRVAEMAEAENEIDIAGHDGDRRGVNATIGHLQQLALGERLQGLAGQGSHAAGHTATHGSWLRPYACDGVLDRGRRKLVRGQQDIGTFRQIDDRGEARRLERRLELKRVRHERGTVRTIV